MPSEPNLAINPTITAPITGRIGLRLVDPGNIVHASDATGLLVITQMQPISVLFTISEDQLSAVLGKLRARQALPVDAFDREMFSPGHQFENPSELLKIDPLL